MEIESVKNSYDKVKNSSECYFEDKVFYFVEGRLPTKTAHFMAKHLVKCPTCHKKSLLIKKFLADFGRLVPLKHSSPITEGQSESHIRQIVTQLYIENKISQVVGERGIHLLTQIKKFVKSPETLYYLCAITFLGLLALLIIK